MPITVLVFHRDRELVWRPADLDQYLDRSRVFLEAQAQCDVLSGASIAFPASEPARRAVGIGNALPHVVDGRAEGAREDQVGAARGWNDATGRVWAHAVSFFSRG